MVLALLILFGSASANNAFPHCVDIPGLWMSALYMDVVDFVATGDTTDPRWYCRQDDPDGGIYFSMRIEPENLKAQSTERHRISGDGPMRARDNSKNCMDPGLYWCIEDAIRDSKNGDCKFIADTIEYRINKPNYAVICVKYKGYGFDDIITDPNYCTYDVPNGMFTWTVVIAKLNHAIPLIPLPYMPENQYDILSNPFL
ncbi:unnamed protein product [Caenorhabditis bovis]|uniref:Uncharacterized protein n=1 Tax=Caenorhabditis bovis TaxID=2654633 RepID=A0A8S1F3Y0_9PELO|nr:unnamed protein product [Caenorhabditis bovis]